MREKDIKTPRALPRVDISLALQAAADKQLQQCCSIANDLFAIAFFWGGIAKQFRTVAGIDILEIRGA